MKRHEALERMIENYEAGIRNLKQETQKEHDDKIFLEMAKDHLISLQKQWGNIFYWEMYDRGQWDMDWQGVREKAITLAEERLRVRLSD